MIPRNELDVIVSLFPERNYKTIKEIQKKGTYSYERTYSALWSLRDKKVVDLKKYGNVIVAKLIYTSDFALFGFVYYSIIRKNKFYEDQKNFFSLEKSAKTRKLQSIINSEELIACIKEIENLNTELISILEVSTEPKNKIVFFCVGDNKLKDESLKIEYKHNIRIDPIIETENSLIEKKDDLKYLNSVVLKGFEKFYTIFYL